MKFQEDLLLYHFYVPSTVRRLYQWAPIFISKYILRIEIEHMLFEKKTFVHNLVTYETSRVVLQIFSIIFLLFIIYFNKKNIF